MMSNRIWPTLRCHSLTELVTWYRSVRCPACHAPVGAPCADRRSYDKDLYGVRVHRKRAQVLRSKSGTEALDSI